MALQASHLLDALKLLALVAMTLDHVDAAVFARQREPLMLIGRVAFPVFAFAAAFGASRTRFPRRYLRRLFICALVSQPFFYLSIGAQWWYLNTVFTLLCGVAAVLLWRFGYGWLAPLARLAAAVGDYGPAGAAIVLAAAWMLSGSWGTRIAGVVVYALLSPLLWPTVNQLLVAVPTAVLALMLWSRLGSRVRPSGARHVFYVYYPLHLAVLAAYAQWAGEGGIAPPMLEPMRVEHRQTAARACSSCLAAVQRPPVSGIDTPPIFPPPSAPPRSAPAVDAAPGTSPCRPPASPADWQRPPRWRC